MHTVQLDRRYPRFLANDTKLDMKEEGHGLYPIICFCMSFYKEDPNITVVGACMYMCYHISQYVVLKNAILALPIFFVLVITFRISATSPSMNAFLLVCQVLTLPLQVRVVSSAIYPVVNAVILAVCESLYGFWNLDFFRTLYTRFCLHPKFCTLQV